MSPLETLYVQCRTLDRTVLFKVKEDNSIVIKIYTLSQERILKTTFTSAKIGIPDIRFRMTQNPISLVEEIVRKGLLPMEQLPSLSPSDISIEECLQEIQKLIHQSKAKNIFENADLKKFTCPLSFEVFEDPVIDDHGHTFEKREIERCLEINNSCPINRKPIHSLTPNRLIRQTIEDAQRKDPIPTLSLFVKANPKLAEKSIEMAQTYEQEEEYEEALKCYTSALQYTNSPDAYAPLPRLFQKMQQTQKAILASLYLVQYQLQEKHISQAIPASQAMPTFQFQAIPTFQDKAIQTIENIQQIDPQQPVSLLLFKLYVRAGHSQQAITLALKKGESLAKEHPQEAVSLYKLALIVRPYDWKIYSLLEPLLENPIEKVHFLLKGACHALEQKNYDLAQEFCQKVERYEQDQEKVASFPSLLNQLVQLDLLKRQDQRDALKKKLHDLTDFYGQRGLFSTKLKVYKMLVQLEKDPFYYREIINTYETLQKPLKALAWRQMLLPILVQNKKWGEAELLIQEILKSNPGIISPDKLCDLYTQLGQAQQQSGQIAQVEATYRTAFELFHKTEHALALAASLQEQNKNPESVRTYYEAASLALLDDRLADVDLCVRQIRQIDPRMQNLDASQRMHLLTQNKIFKLQMESQANQASFQKLLAKVEEAECKMELPKTSAIPSIAFGKALWEKFFGYVGIEPPLPPDIEKILNGPCPFWPDKKVRDTHMLVLVPQTVNGQPLILKTLGELVKKPRQGTATKYRDFNLGLYIDLPAPKAHWALMSRDVVPDSRNKSYDKQQALVASLSQKTRLPYEVPTILDAAICIFMEYFCTGTRLYNDNPWSLNDNPSTFTRCQEKYDGNWHLVVGSFGRGGLYFGAISHDGDHANSGVGGLRKFV